MSWSPASASAAAVMVLMKFRVSLGYDSELSARLRVEGLGSGDYGAFWFRAWGVVF